MSLTIGRALERICWTRMQAESGEGLTRILRRKELERRAGEGTFFWGIGNAPSRAVPALVQTAATVDVIFSVMKSRPKARDVAPSRVVVWQSYIGPSGVLRPIPKHVLVTSRATTRSHHYALICHSDAPLDVEERGSFFDPGAFRNCGAGGAVGASQVTALLERHGPDERTDYRVAMRARLTDDLWVKLVDPIEVTASARAKLDRGVEDEGEWLDFVDMVRKPGRRVAAPTSTQLPLFAV